MQPSDINRFRHMLDAAREAAAFSSQGKRSDLDEDHVRALGLVKCLEIVGEAASKIDPGVRSLYPEVPWQQIIAMRNRLVHAYFDVDPDQVWSALTEDLPPLIAELEKILKTFPPSTP